MAGFLHVCWNLEVGTGHPLTLATRAHPSVNADLMKPFITLSRLNQRFLLFPRCSPPPVATSMHQFYFCYFAALNPAEPYQRCCFAFFFFLMHFNCSLESGSISHISSFSRLKVEGEIWYMTNFCMYSGLPSFTTHTQTHTDTLSK